MKVKITNTLGSLWLSKEKLQTLLDVVSKKGEKGVELTISQGDRVSQYGQNVSAWVSQAKEDRDKPKFYVGNGKTFWSDGQIKDVIFDDQQSQAAPKQNDNGNQLPF